MNAVKVAGYFGSRMTKFLREPLLHFLVLGGVLFLGFHVMRGDTADDKNVIIIDNGVVADILLRYAAVWQGPPTPSDMRGLIENYIHDEVLYREGVAMGLQENDPVVRRRVRQKMDVIAEESESRAAPDDAALQAYLDRHSARYAKPAVVSFEQVMVDPTRHGAETGRVVATILRALEKGDDPKPLGDNGLLPLRQHNIGVDRIARDFGEAFAHALVRVPEGTWQGPIPSGFGLHLVRVTTRIPERTPALDEARGAVMRDWENDRRQRAITDYYDKARKNFEIVIKADIPQAANPEISPNPSQDARSGKEARP